MQAEDLTEADDLVLLVAETEAEEAGGCVLSTKWARSHVLLSTECAGA